MTRTAPPTWDDTRHLLERFDGAASEIFVIDLPASHWTQVLSRIAQIPRLEVVIDGRESLAHPKPFDSAWLHRMRSAPEGDTWYGLQSDAEGVGRLQINLWPVSASEPLDLEFVFWNDLAFPPHLSSTERAARFDRLVRLVEDCRRGAAGARCILASEHNGDPREILGHPGTLVW